MLKRNITYTNFNDEQVTKTFYFHLSQPEMVEVEARTEGGFIESLKRMIAAEDTAGLITEFKWFILTSYGIKEEDGEHFEKSEELSNRFSKSAAYIALFTELASDETAAAEFIKGVFPKGMVIDEKTIDIQAKVLNETDFERMQRASQTFPSSLPPAGSTPVS